MSKKIGIGILIGFVIICLDVLILGNDSACEAQENQSVKTDEGNIYLKNGFMKTAKKGVQELTVPLCFSWKKENVLELYSHEQQVMIEPPTAALALPETVWEESITYEGTSYLAAFERISPVYDVDSEFYAIQADYQLVLKDENGNMIANQVITGYPITMEEVHWLKDISGDGFSDVILCSYFFEGKYDLSTQLNFLIWNKEKLMYESKPLAEYMDAPFWNEELSSIIFFSQADDTSMEMYTFRGGEWQLNDKLVRGDWTKKEPWLDENSIWCRENVQNENLIPWGEDWDTEDKELEGGERTWKWVREKG